MLGNDTQTKLPFCNFKDTRTGGKMENPTQKVPAWPRTSPDTRRQSGSHRTGPHPKPNIMRSERDWFYRSEKAVIDLSLDAQKLTMSEEEGPAFQEARKSGQD